METVDPPAEGQRRGFQFKPLCEGGHFLGEQLIVTATLTKPVNGSKVHTLIPSGLHPHVERPAGGFARAAATGN